jgi:opacity protein-like surface antigen
MKRVIIAATLASLLAPPPASAQITVGARLGAGFALGDVGGTLPMSDWTQGQIPLQLDVLYRVTSRVRVGGYFSWGFGLPGDACDGLGCSAAVTRLGVEGTYAFAGRSFVPWVGAGIGYEWNTIDAGAEKASFTGFELLGLQGGADFAVSPRLSVGPYVAFSLGQYDEGAIGALKGPIRDKRMHQWLGLGFRGSFDL